ncbi:MAG: type VI secretion system tip protein TssI/VgrG [Polyangiaceae bacterium]
MAAKDNIRLGIYSSALAGDDKPLVLLGVEGREELSRLFQFQLLLFRAGPPFGDEELDALVSEPCVIAMGPRKSDVVHGALSSLAHIGGAPGGGTYYRATLIPNVYALQLGRRSAVYQNTTVPDMVAGLLGARGLQKGKDFDIRITDDAKSPTHEYIVQYQESDWDFIQRWLEHEGYFYWFTHTDGLGLVIADANEDATPIEEPATLPFRNQHNLAQDDKDSVWSFYATRTRVPASVTLIDYNYRRPLDLLFATQKVDRSGFGHVFLYGDHFKDKSTGAAWAKIRAEELAVDRYVVTGETDCARLRVGHTFKLEEHEHADYDGDYLVTSVEHTVGLAAGALKDEASARGAERSYRGRFTAIPLDVPFRPKRLTPWPSIHGILHGHIASDGSGEYAELDDQGRYKVKLPFDLGSSQGQASSRWIRMAQAYSGSGYGAHHPQHKGGEVLIAHLDGDPDRPVIIGAVPNAVTPGPVSSANASQSVLKTASGIRVVMEDLQK